MEKIGDDRAVDALAKKRGDDLLINLSRLWQRCHLLAVLLTDVHDKLPDYVFLDQAV
jgi:hypothetical protein